MLDFSARNFHIPSLERFERGPSPIFEGAVAESPRLLAHVGWSGARPLTGRETLEMGRQARTAALEEVMELNTKGRYAVMAMADLAKHGGDASVPLSAIAERQRLSLDYLEQI